MVKVKVIYDGPGNVVVVDTYGRHFKNKIKEYPADFAESLVKTRKYNRFRIVEKVDSKKKAKTRGKKRNKK